MTINTNKHPTITARDYSGAPSNLPRIVLQQLAILLSHRDKELINGHGRVDCDLPPKQCVDFVFLVDRRERRPR